MKYKVESHNNRNAKIEDPCQHYNKMRMIVMARMITAIVVLILLNF